ncbi:MAG: DUF456 domain-containing protein [Chloroflexota bacterium]|nr:DUF456 domain-containing protein [Chloroflexota bacterium]
MEDLAGALGLLLMGVGFVGVFLPLVPGTPVMLLGAWVYSALTGFNTLTWPWLLLMTLLTAASVALDFVAAAWMTRKMGASRRATAGALLGTLVGVLFLGAYGTLVGGMGGAVLGELSVRRTLRPALKSGAGAFVGFVLTMLVDIVVALVLLGIYIAFALM